LEAARLETLEADAGYGIRVRLLHYNPDGERIVAASGKLSLSRKPLDRILSIPEEEVEEWIRETLARGHMSPWEHSVYTWTVEGCTRVCSHQLVRHRIASYIQQSMRYSEAALRDLALMAAGLAGVECPARPGRSQQERRSAYACYSRAVREALEAVGPAGLYNAVFRAYLIPYPAGSPQGLEMARTALEATATYYHLLSLGVPLEDARYVIPHMVRTRLIVTMNARELAESFIPLRSCMRAQWEIRLVAWALRGLLLRVHPRLFKYTGPRCVLAENRLRPRPVTPEEIASGSVAPLLERCPEGVPRRGIPACLGSAMGWRRGGV